MHQRKNSIITRKSKNSVPNIASSNNRYCGKSSKRGGNLVLLNASYERKY